MTGYRRSGSRMTVRGVTALPGMFDAWGPKRFVAAQRWIINQRRSFATTSPETFSAKVRFRMTYSRDPLLRVFADKLATRKYVEETIGSGYLPECLGVRENARNFSLGSLPPRCVIKPTHGSGAVVALDDRAAEPDHLPELPKPVAWFPLTIRLPQESLHPGWAAKLFHHWLSRDYSYVHPWFEWAYFRNPRRLVIEELLDDGGQGFPQDIKVHVFHGRCGMIQTFGERSGPQEHRTFFSPEGELLQLHSSGYSHLAAQPDSLPKNFVRLVELAEELAKPVEYLRVDFYSIGDRIVVGELTNYPAGGQVDYLNSAGEAWPAPMWRPSHLASTSTSTRRLQERHR